MALVKYVQEVQSSVSSFERIVTATSVPSDINAYPRLTLPSWFVREHGDKIRLSAVLQNKASGGKWTVQVVVRHPERNPQVMFYGGGWKDFAACHGLAGGDRLTFTLTAMSEFEVSISDNAGDLPIPWPRKRSKTTRYSQRLRDKSHVKNATVQKPKHNVPGPRLGKLGLKCTPEEEVADSAGFDSSISEFPLVSPSKSCHGANPDPSFNRSGSSRNSTERKRNQAREYENDSPRKRLQTSLPCFVKQLRIHHFQRMEIPRGFFLTYADRLHTYVKLQGIHDASPVRTVRCCLRRDGKHWRLDLTDGWKKFSSENSLKAGQKFVFTLTADSFFEVRRVYS